MNGTINVPCKKSTNHILLDLHIFTSLPSSTLYIPLHSASLLSNHSPTFSLSFISHFLGNKQKMETQRSKKASSSLLLWALVAGLLSQDLVSTVASSFVDQKNYYFPPPPDPNSGTPPSGLSLSLYIYIMNTFSHGLVRTE